MSRKVKALSWKHNFLSLKKTLCTWEWACLCASDSLLVITLKLTALKPKTVYLQLPYRPYIAYVPFCLARDKRQERKFYGKIMLNLHPQCFALGRTSRDKSFFNGPHTIFFLPRHYSSLMVSPIMNTRHVVILLVFYNMRTCFLWVRGAMKNEKNHDHIENCRRCYRAEKCI